MMDPKAVPVSSDYKYAKHEMLFCSTPESSRSFPASSKTTSDSSANVQETIARVDMYFMDVIAKKEAEICQLRKLLGKRADSVPHSNLLLMVDAAEVMNLKVKAHETNRRLESAGANVRHKQSALLRSMITLVSKEEQIDHLSKSLTRSQGKLARSIAESHRRRDDLKQVQDTLAKMTLRVEDLTSTVRTKDEENSRLTQQLQRKSDELDSLSQPIVYSAPSRLCESLCHHIDIEPADPSWYPRMKHDTLDRLECNPASAVSSTAATSTIDKNQLRVADDETITASEDPCCNNSQQSPDSTMAESFAHLDGCITPIGSAGSSESHVKHPAVPTVPNHTLTETASTSVNNTDRGGTAYSGPNTMPMHTPDTGAVLEGPLADARAQVDVLQSALATREATCNKLQVESDALKEDVSSLRRDSKGYRRAKQRLEQEVAELAETLAADHTRHMHEQKAWDAKEEQLRAQIAHMEETIASLVAAANTHHKSATVDAAVQSSPLPNNPTQHLCSGCATRGDRTIVSFTPEKITGENVNDGDDGHRSVRTTNPDPSPASQPWCSWERSAVRRVLPLAAAAADCQQLPTSGRTVLPLNNVVTPQAGRGVHDPPARLGKVELLQEKDAELAYLQDTLLKQVELCAQLKKQENDMQSKYMACRSQLELLVALDHEDSDQAMKLRQDIVTAKHAATTAKLRKKLADATAQIDTLQEMVMLQRQVRFARKQAPSRHSAGLRTVTLCRDPGQHLGLKLLQPVKDDGYNCAGIRIVAVRTGSPAHESRQIFMGDAIAAVNDVWCLDSSYHTVSLLLQEAGDLVVLSLASAQEVDMNDSLTGSHKVD
eukprot:m.329914 g.329914  ORF g.329914 m.329914 type:complete len:832 (-) comp20453_c0_seq1:94-2589(-)